MPKRREDASTRRFFDEFPVTKIPRLRATGVVQLDAPCAIIPFGDKQKLIDLAHVHFKHGGSWSLFRCPKCARRANRLWLIDDLPRCRACCDALNIKHRSTHGFGRMERRRVADQKLDELVAKVTTQTPLRYNPAPASWQGKAKLVYNSRRLTEAMRRDMIALRLQMLAYQDAKGLADHKDRLKSHQPLAQARRILNLEPIWRAKSREDLERALDAAQQQIIAALQSDDHKIRMAAVRLVRRTKQARERGVSA